MENFVGNQMQQMLLEESSKPEQKLEQESPANVKISDQSDADSDEFFDAVDDLFKHDSTPSPTPDEELKEK